MLSLFRSVKIFCLIPAIFKKSLQTFIKDNIKPTRSWRCTPFVTLIPSIAPKLISSEITPFDVEENIGELLNLVRHAIDRGEIEKAEAILEIGIKICEEYQSYFALPYMYDVLASIALATGKLGKAENLLVRVIEKMIQLDIAEDNDQMIDFKLRLSRIYSLYHEDLLAEIGFSTCLKEQENKILNGDTSTKTGLIYINCLFFYGLHKMNTSEHKTAKKLIDSAYSYAMKLKGLSPYQELMILGTLADLNTEMQDYEIALQNVNSAIILSKGVGSLDLPKLYLKLAKIYIKLDSYNIAHDWLQEAYKLGELFSDARVVDEAKGLIEDINVRIF
ncbi:uncharacterized protein LOC130897198 [Diorhabda carinulata]|uniref:uncharacterized protein LOC130897198 n=1 Tax=Diorhabda carinulata TaxID=1163345 RepID=UPI0025A0FA25|nr:uncharacterized protein LOC130897198 [Diorhabda carinulata]